MTLTPGTCSPNVGALDSGGVRANFVLLLVLIAHGLSGAGFVPLDEAQAISYLRLEKNQC